MMSGIVDVGHVGSFTLAQNQFRIKLVVRNVLKFFDRYLFDLLLTLVTLKRFAFERLIS